MRCNPNADSYGYTNRHTCDYANGYPYSNANSNFDSYGNGNGNRDTYANDNGYSSSNIYDYAYRYSEGRPDTEIAPDTKAATDSPATYDTSADSVLAPSYSCAAAVVGRITFSPEKL